MTDAPNDANPVGRPRIEIDLDLLKELVGIMCTLTECAGVLGVSEDTLNRRLEDAGEVNFAVFFNKYSASGRQSLRRAQFSSAVEGENPTMLIWLGKQYLGQKDKSEVETTFNVTIDKDDADL